METYEDMYNCHQTVVLLYINPLWKCYFDKEVFKSAKIALARWLSWLEHWPVYSPSPQKRLRVQSLVRAHT